MNVPLDLGRRELICEGRCNPDLAALDGAIEQYRKDDSYGGGSRAPIVDASLLRRLRNLRHTLHAQIASDRWSCAECSTVRRF
jgi:hypothetical protein